MGTKRITTLLLVVLIILVSIGYLKFLEVFVPHSELRLSPIWEDNTFQTRYQDPAWTDQNFTQGWNIVWTLGQTNESSGFTAEEGIGDLFAVFDGYNYAHERGVSGIMVQKSVGEIDTTTYPYLVIRHRESSSDFPLMFSFGVTDDKGVWHDGGWHHTSSAWKDLEFDLRRIHNGTIRFVSIRLTNDFNPNYVGGTHHVYIKLIAIYRDSPKWKLSYNEPINASISSENGVLKVHGSGNLSINTIVTGQRLIRSSFDLNKYRYLKVSVMTSSIDVAARIVIWTDSSHSCTVLIKTYNDRNWHTEIIDLSFFSITGNNLYMVELSWMQIYPRSDSSSTVYYRQLSFNSLEGIH